MYLCVCVRAYVLHVLHLSRLLPAGCYSTGRDRKISLLEDVFRKFPHIPVSIEIKENNMQLIEKVLHYYTSVNIQYCAQIELYFSFPQE